MRGHKCTAFDIEKIRTFVGWQGLFERRSYERYRVREGAIAALETPLIRLGQIIEMNRFGLSFSYIADNQQTTGSLQVTILLSEPSFRLQHVQSKIISDSEIATAPPLSSIKMRRMGVQFETLTNEQISKLQYFIRNYTMDKMQGNRSRVQGSTFRVKD